MADTRVQAGRKFGVGDLYAPVTVLYECSNNNSSDDSGLQFDASSGVYISKGSENFIISITSVKYRLQDVAIRYTCDELTNGDKMKWINVPLGDQETYIEEIQSSDLEEFFRVCNFRDEAQRRKYFMVCKLPSYCAIKNQLKEFSAVASLDGEGALARELPKRIKIESSPFGLTSANLFNGYTNYGYVNYESANGEFWLTDCKYMENMHGGVVFCNHTASIGLVWGNVKWAGHGELMVLVSWGVLLRKLAGFWEPAEAALPTDGYGQVQLPRPLPVGNKVLGLRVCSRYGVYSWGSGVVVDRGVIMTNKHVVTGSPASDDMPKSIEIGAVSAGGGVVIEDPEVDVHVLMLPGDSSHDVCFLRCDALDGDGIRIAGGGLLKDSGGGGSAGPAAVGQTVVSVGHGLFLAGAPLLSVGNITKIKGDLIASSSACWAGCSGGAVVNAAGELVALMANNVRTVAGAEVLERMNLGIGVGILRAVWRAVDASAGARPARAVSPRPPASRPIPAAAAAARSHSAPRTAPAPPAHKSGGKRLPVRESRL